MLLISPSLYAHNYPCTFTYAQYPDLCLEIRRSSVFLEPAQQEVLEFGKLYFYFWKKGSELKNISNEYDVAVSVAMPTMMESSVCVSGKLVEPKWENRSVPRYVGETAIMPGLYRIGGRVREKGSNDRYSDMKRLISVPMDDPVYNFPSKVEFAVTTGFTYQFVVPQ